MRFPFVAFFVALPLAGCAVSTTTPPTIDSLDMPATATLGADGEYTLNGSISAHDPDGTMQEIHIVQPKVGDFKISFLPSSSLDKSPVTVKFPGSFAKGQATYTVSLVSTGGAESTSIPKTVTLQ